MVPNFSCNRASAVNTAIKGVETPCASAKMPGVFQQHFQNGFIRRINLVYSRYFGSILASMAFDGFIRSKSKYPLTIKCWFSIHRHPHPPATHPPPTTKLNFSAQVVSLKTSILLGLRKPNDNDGNSAAYLT